MSLTGGRETPKSRIGQAYYWQRYYASQSAWRDAAEQNLMDWGFNTRGAWSDPAPGFQLPVTVSLSLGQLVNLIWSDLFNPDMSALLLKHATELIAPYRQDPKVIGYFTDNEVGWWNSPLFQWYLTKGWENHTKRVLWTLLDRHYQHSWAQLLKDWVPQGDLKNFEALKQAGASLKLRPGGQGIELVNQFTYLCTQRYYQAVHDAIRQVHPEALILGDRLPLYYNPDAVRGIGDSVDVISTNYNVDTRDGWVAPYYFEGLQRLSDKPVLVSEFFFAAHENRSGNRNQYRTSPGHLMTVNTQAERARGVANALRNFARFPNVVGVHWFQYSDEPTGGRADGEDYNMGLVDIANRPYELVTDVMRTLNPQLDAVHRLSGSRAVNRRVVDDQVVRVKQSLSPIDIRDDALTDWDKAATRLRGFQTLEPDVPFGDVHVTWRPEGLYFSSIAANYVDLNLLHYDETFPLSETFQFHIVIEDATQMSRHYALHLFPKISTRYDYDRGKRIGLDVKLYRYVDFQPAELIPSDPYVQRLKKPIPHIVLEGVVPAAWLGVPSLKPNQKLRVNIALVKFYRDAMMSLAGAAHQANAHSASSLENLCVAGSMNSLIVGGCHE